MKAKGDVRVFLVFDKNDLKQKIHTRIQSGEELATRDIKTKSQQDDWWDGFIDWDNYNLELIKQAFDVPNNQYAEDYERNSGGGGIFFSDEVYTTPTLEESIQSAREEMQYQVRKLKWFFEKIDLLKISDSIVSFHDNRSKFHQLINLLSRFHKIAQELRERRQSRETLLIKDEYDIQDLLNSLLYLYFDDIRKEDSSPSHAGSNSRLDFVLKKEKIIIEVKMSSNRLGARELGEQLLIDIGRYKEYPDINDLVIFIYDKDDHIRNKRGLVSDLEKQSTNGWKVTVIINPD